MWNKLKYWLYALAMAVFVTAGVFCSIHPENAKYIAASIALLCAAQAITFANILGISAYNDRVERENAEIDEEQFYCEIREQAARQYEQQKQREHDEDNSAMDAEFSVILMG
jgi:hypothetical protein